MEPVAPAGGPVSVSGSATGTGGRSIALLSRKSKVTTGLDLRLGRRQASLPVPEVGQEDSEHNGREINTPALPARPAPAGSTARWTDAGSVGLRFVSLGAENPSFSVFAMLVTEQNWNLSE